MTSDAASSEPNEWRSLIAAIDTALIGAGVVMVQPYLTSADIDMSALVSVIALAFSIPLLSALVLLALHDKEGRRMRKPLIVDLTHGSARLAGFIGVAAGFWHISWLAGTVLIASAMLAVTVYSAGYGWLGQRTTQGRDRQA